MTFMRMVGCTCLMCLLAGPLNALETPTHEHLPRWRGFNLLEMFQVHWPNSGRFQEEDFRLISEWGFNFVRLPLDYRFWIVDGDWERIDEVPFQAIDEAVAFGKKYGIHVCLNLHRAPGHTVAQPPEPISLWESEEALRVCALHWRYIAHRYKGIPNERLSFNLLNEPFDVDCEAYAQVVNMLVDAIREEDPDRLIIADGIDWGKTPCDLLIPLKVAQSGRGYQPAFVSHYQASWYQGADRWPTPQWPARLVRGGFLYGPQKADLISPLRILLEIEKPAVLTLTVGDVSSFARLQIAREDTGDILFAEDFPTGPGEGPWKESVYHEKWNGYQCTYDKDVSVELPAGSYALAVTAPEGDWTTLTRIAISRDGNTVDALNVIPKWEEANESIAFRDETGKFQTTTTQDAAWLWEDTFKAWASLKEQGVGVMVGEWGAHNRTPHDVTLRWMEDLLQNFQRAGMGWALWNLRGSIGILNSGREDVEYESMGAHQLDRKMLELLQRY